MLVYIIAAAVIVSAMSFVGLLLVFRHETRPTIMKPVISLAAGTLLAVALTDLIPEAIEADGIEPHTIMYVVLASIAFFFLFERILHWHHCRCEEHGTRHQGDDKRRLIYINLIGDGLHNVIDGFLIASAFMFDVWTGIFATLAVIAHEIPQEFSDFGVLMYAGLSRAKALAFNFVIALLAIGGATVFYFIGSRITAAIPVMAAFAAGNFIYLATADLVPELHHEHNPRNVIVHSLWFMVGIILIVGLGVLLPHAD